MKQVFKDKKFILLMVAIAIVVALEVLSLLSIHIPMPYAPFVFGAFILGIGYSVIWKGIRAFATLRFSSINLLILIAVIGAFYLQEFPEAAVLVVFYMLGERLEDIGIERSQSALDELVEKSPKTAVVKATGQAVAIETIPVGTIIEIRPGDLIPVDGKITAGETVVDEAAITGEPIPKDKRRGEQVFAGTLNKSGFIEVETTKLATDTTFAKIIKLTFEAQENKSVTQKFIEKFAKFYTPSIILLAAGLIVVPVFLLQQDLNHWLKQGITLLVIACPCALVIAAPVAIFAAIGNASTRGALVKGGKFIEALARIRVLALDKTRTITFGNPIVSDVFPLNGNSREELLACTAGAEIFSEHPLAQAVVDAARREGFEPHRAELFKAIAGKGATAKCLVCEDETIYLGKLSYIHESQPSDADAEKIVRQLSAEGKTSIAVSFGQGVAGIIGLTDEIKPESADAISHLKVLGVEPVMLTGDNEHAGKYVGDKVGISRVYGSLMPDGKAEQIKQLRAESEYVGMVGDGINDAPALAISSVGIAMGAAGSDAAIESANIALMNDKLSLIPFLIQLSRATLSRIKLNTILAIGVKVTFIGLAIAGYSNLVLAIVADVGIALVVIILSLSLLKFR